MKSVQDILKGKGTEIHSVIAETTVFDALRLMAKENIGAVLVLDAEGTISGIFSERDYARKIVLEGKSSQDTPVREVMTKNVYYIDASKSVEDCMALMTNKKIRHLPVFRDGKLIGVVSIGDVVKASIAEKDFLIDQFQHYITGSL